MVVRSGEDDWYAFQRDRCEQALATLYLASDPKQRAGVQYNPAADRDLVLQFCMLCGQHPDPLGFAAWLPKRRLDQKVPQSRAETCEGHRQAQRPTRGLWTLLRLPRPKPRLPTTPRRFCGGGPRPEDQNLLFGLFMSVLGDEAPVTRLLNQDWVETWKGWEEMADNGTDAVAMDCALMNPFEDIRTPNGSGSPWP